MVRKFGERNKELCDINMFSHHNSRDVVPVEKRMMAHAFVVSWGCPDPYIQTGAVIAQKEDILGTAYSYLAGDRSSWNTQRLFWDDPTVYDYVVHAELKALECLKPEQSSFFDITLYLTSIPHPRSVCQILGRGIKNIIYARCRTIMTPKNYEKIFAKHASQYSNVKIEPYTDKLHWVRDKLDLMESHLPHLFS